MIRAHVDARRFDQRVRFERLTEGQDAGGDMNPTWTPLITCWASVDGQKAGERFVEGGERSIGAYTVWIRADVHERVSLRVKDRAVWLRSGGSVVLDIEDIPDQQRRGRLIAVFARRGLTAG